KARHTRRNGTFKLFASPERTEVQLFIARQSLYLLNPSAHYHVGPYHVFSQHMTKRPRDHISQGESRSELLRGDSANPCNGRLSVVHHTYPLPHRHVGEAGSKPHAIEQYDTALLYFVVQPIAVLLETYAVCQFESLGVPLVRATMIFLQDVDHVQSHIATQVNCAVVRAA